MKKSLLTVFLITACTLCGCTKAPVSPSPAAQETQEDGDSAEETSRSMINDDFKIPPFLTSK